MMRTSCTRQELSALLTGQLELKRKLSCSAVGFGQVSVSLQSSFGL